MRRWQVGAALGALVLGWQVVSAQAPTSLDGHRIPIRTDTMAEYLIKGADTIRTGYVIDRVSVDGDQLTRIYEGHSKATGNMRDSIVDRVGDLHPIVLDDQSAEMVALVRYGADSVTGWMRTPTGDSVKIAVGLPKVVYDGASFDLVIRASDLREGFELDVPIFEVGPNSVSEVGGRVAGSETIGGHDCWVFKGHFGSMAVSFWIDKDTRALRQQLLQPSVDFGILLTLAHIKPRDSRQS